MQCYCCSRKLFKLCCEPILSGQQWASDAEQLMRSRYTAYVLKNVAYLLQTWHPDFRPNILQLNEADCPQWFDLTIKHVEVLSENTATVTFFAKYKINGKAYRMHEISRFEKNPEGRWLYLEGQLS
jgi:SEC-C motif domain protein